MQVLYFAWVRERIGKDGEQIALSEGIKTIFDLSDWLSAKGDNYAHALGNRAKLRVALNQVFVPWETEISNDDEVAFFPPVTGG